MTEVTPSTTCATCGHTPKVKAVRPKKTLGRPKGSVKYTPAEREARNKANIKKWVDNHKEKRAMTNRANYLKNRTRILESRASRYLNSKAAALAVSASSDSE